MPRSMSVAEVFEAQAIRLACGERRDGRAAMILTPNVSELTIIGTFAPRARRGKHGRHQGCEHCPGNLTRLQQLKPR